MMKNDLQMEIQKRRILVSMTFKHDLNSHDNEIQFNYEHLILNRKLP